MRRTICTIAALALAYPFGVAAQGDIASILAICDRVAASPLDKDRPAGVAGVATDKLDPGIAIAACEPAAKAAPDNPRIMYQLGRAYWAGKNYEAARVTLSKADEAGHLLATNNLAILYLQGLGVPADASRGIRLFEKAANGRLPIAMGNLGQQYFVAIGSNGAKSRQDKNG